MTGTNHALTGAFIGATITAPFVALPLAFVSHFVLDALPHYGDGTGTNVPASAHLRKVVKFDISLVTLLFLSILILQPANWLIIILAAGLAMAPDLMWLPAYVRGVRKREPPREHSTIMRWHHAIQWCERPWGVVIEVLWLALLAPIFFVLAAKF
jgi:hypothetical protein